MTSSSQQSCIMDQGTAADFLRQKIKELWVSVLRNYILTMHFSLLSGYTKGYHMKWDSMKELNICYTARMET